MTALWQRILATSVVEEQVSHEGRRARGAGQPDAPDRPISAMSRGLYVILEEWRAAERALAAAQPGSAECSAAQADSGRLRLEYQAAFSQRQKG